jgi:hypothetical protein
LLETNPSFVPSCHPAHYISYHLLLYIESSLNLENVGSDLAREVILLAMVVLGGISVCILRCRGIMVFGGRLVDVEM